MSQFISKTKTDIQKHLALKAEEYKDLSEIIAAAKRIERSFNPGGGHRNTNKPPLDPHPTLSILPQLLLSSMGATGNLSVTTAILLVTSKAAVLKEQ